MMDKFSNEKLLDILEKRERNVRLDLSMHVISDLDLSGRELLNIDFGGTSFERVNLEGADMDGDNVSKCFFIDCKMRNIKLTNANASSASFRNMDLSGADFSGTDFYCAALEGAVLDDIKTDEKTKFLKMICPETGAFLAWKIGSDRRLIRLLIPADARRTSATGLAGRCDKAKVLSITSEDGSIAYDWACATVTDKFIYRTGEWAYPADFNPYRWVEDAPGIHFFMEREHALNY